MIERKLS